MSASYFGQCRQPHDDEHFASIPGFNARVPSSPYAHRQTHRGAQLLDSYRPNYERDGYHNARRSPAYSTVDTNRTRRSTAAYREEDRTVSHGIQRSRPSFDNPTQYLAEAFAIRQRQLAETAARTTVVHRYSSQHTTTVGGRLPHRSRTHDVPSLRASSSPGPQIKREYPEELEEGEIRSPYRESSLFVPQDQSGNPHPDPESHATVSPDTPTPSLNPRQPKVPIFRDVPKGCTCAIEHTCPHKHDKLSDCRTLVQENARWQKRKKDFEENYNSELSTNDDPQLETFAELGEMRTMGTRLRSVMQRQSQSDLLHDDFLNIAASVRCFQYNSVTKEKLGESRLLDKLNTFLSASNRLRLSRLDFPIQLVEDLTILLTKWQAGDFSVRAHRGCVYSKQTRQWSIDPNCSYRRKADFYGHGHLVNGQVWPSRIAMVRDGAHGATRAGIGGSKKHGATSIVLNPVKSKGNEYADVDEGDKIAYFSTALGREENDMDPTNLKDLAVHRADRVTENAKGDGPTDNTEKLITSYRTGKPVRVFRGFRLRKIVRDRPKKGFRYDALYTVTNYELVNEKRQIYKFFLERKEGQGPIRNVWVPTQDSDDDKKKNKKRKRDEAES
ncbi:hypothetical protein H2200_004939 [Cladophialophora chaetospira]|uniref:YDG domain-containing protein n=1 Tax=Cladophialophora chaetospira TaxID=386627 RepID=A0AA38XE90_9EURO|nr:hypothetical protein H2200_004939 [Cladophialophora chaetospira]